MPEKKEMSAPQKALLKLGLARDIDHAMADAFSFDGSRCDRIVALLDGKIEGAQQ